MKFMKLLVAGSILLAAGLFGCGQEGPTNSPAVTDDSAPEYVFVANPLTMDQFWRYSLETNTLDTLYLDSQMRPYSLGVSNSRRELYLSPQDDPYIKVFDIDSGVQIGEFAPSPLFEWIIEMLPSPDGQKLALWDQRTTMIVDLSDKSIQYWDSTYAIQLGSWSEDSRRLYQTARDSGGFYPVFSVIDLDADPKRRQIGGNRGWRCLMKPSWDETQIYSIESGPTSPRFFVYDIAQDSMVFEYAMTSSFGDIVVTPDGLHVYFTSPKSNDESVELPASPLIYEYDVAANTISRVINMSTLASESLSPPIDMQQLWLSSDGTRLIGASMADGAYFADYSLTNSQLKYGHQFTPWGNSWLLSN